MLRPDEVGDYRKEIEEFVDNQLRNSSSTFATPPSRWTSRQVLEVCRLYTEHWEWTHREVRDGAVELTFRPRAKASLMSFLEPAAGSGETRERSNRAYSHYFKDVSALQTVDVYRVLVLFGVTDPCLQHALKKLLVAGGRGSKDAARDVREAVVSLERWLEMRAEDEASSAKEPVR